MTLVGSSTLSFRRVILLFALDKCTKGVSNGPDVLILSGFDPLKVVSCS